MDNPFSGLRITRTFIQHGGGNPAFPAQGGIDYAATHIPVIACASGTVTQRLIDSAGNSWVTVTAAPGVSYSHLHMKSFTVVLGSSVAQGQSLGISGGATGDYGKGQATGPHIHWHFTINGVRVDPAAYVAAHAGGTPPPTGDDDMAQPFYYIASSNNATVTVGAGDIWVRSQPGEPLRRLTGAQAQEYFARDGLDYNSPNVKSWTGAQFDAAFAEDATVHQYNMNVHPWLATDSV
jgi:murein DD-endopeptidase MepM/ murein hydrolase activator NlpD